MTDDAELEALADRLRAAADRVGPMPDVVLDSAKAALSLRALDAELLALVSDSDTMAAGVRGPSTRQLVFQAGEIVVELQVDQVAGGVTVRGVVTGAAGELFLERPDGHHPIAIDEDGWFTVSNVPAGPVRFRCTAPDDTPSVTSWVRL